MTVKDQLFQELPQLSEELASEVLGFLRSVQSRSVSTPTPRPHGLCAGEFTVPDDFDAPLPEDILSAFENPT
jgi:Protein of unknown function (DUF2281)